MISARSPSKAKGHLKGVPAPNNWFSSTNFVAIGVHFDSTAQILAVHVVDDGHLRLWSIA